MPKLFLRLHTILVVIVSSVAVIEFGWIILFGQSGDIFHWIIAISMCGYIGYHWADMQDCGDGWIRLLILVVCYIWPLSTCSFVFLSCCDSQSSWLTAELSMRVKWAAFQELCSFSNSLIIPDTPYFHVSSVC